jgi:hypothetical protein
MHHDDNRKTYSTLYPYPYTWIVMRWLGGLNSLNKYCEIMWM